MKEDECPFCGGVLKKGRAEYRYADTSLGKFDAEICENCNEVFFTEDSSKLIDEKAKELGIWGLKKETTISYSGHSLMVRIPKSIADFMNLKRGSKVIIMPKGRKELAVEIQD